jgi:uncharacterized protein (DUF2336 family)
MIGLLQRVFRGRRDDAISYEESKRLSGSTDPAERRRVARYDGVRPELLYFLANDPDPSVRAAVAGNSATPMQADLLLARDGDEAVRRDLARKIAQLAPGLSAQESDRLQHATYEVLEILVRDQITKVRQIIAETLKNVVDAPPEIIRRLARDFEIAVAGPVLQFSPVLSDGDLIEIIGNAPTAGAAEAVARRAGVSEALADAIDRSGDVAAITALLENPNAQIREETLDRLVDRAPKIIPWHRPMVGRPRLSGNAARRLATFVAANLLETLRARKDLDPETTREVASAVMRRLAEEGSPVASPGAGTAPAGQSVPAADRARKMYEAGKLNDEALLTALRQGDRALVRAGLAVLSGIPLGSVDKVLAAQSAKGIVALAWRAGLGMRTAIRLQVVLGRVAQSAVLEPRPDGGYPLTEEAMRWQLDFLTGGAAR